MGIGRFRCRDPLLALLARLARTDHDWVKTEIGGGLVRRGCATCGHVQIDLTSGDSTPRSPLERLEAS